MRKVTRVLSRTLAAAALVAGLAGCATPPWVPAEPLYRSAPHRYTVELPEGWVRWTQDRDQDLFLTKDGPLLQAISIERVPVGAELKYTKKKLTKGMIPQEAAEVILDNLGSSDRVTAFEVRENAPARVAGAPGFKAVVTYKNKNGLRIKSVLYGCLAGDALFAVRYSAPQRYYFDRDVKAFEKVVRTFALERT